MGYSLQVLHGVSWMSSFRLITRLVTFLKTAIIARALTPSQFGLFGIASLALSFLEMLTETGVNVIIIQTKKDIHEFIDSAWVVSIIRGILISLVIFLAAPFLSTFFHSPQAKEILYFMSLVPLVRGFINPAIIQLQKELRFKQEFFFRSAIFLCDAVVSIVLVIITQSAYSLVWGMLAGAILEVILSFLVITPTPKFVIDKTYLSEMFHKGKWVTLYGVFNYIAQEGDNIVVGRILGTSALGMYQMGYKISTLPISEVTDVVGKVVFPVYTKIGEDKKRLQRAFFRSTGLITIVTTIMGAVIFFFPREIITILLGDRWLSVAPVLQILAIYGVLRAVSGTAGALFFAVRKQHYVTVMTFARFAGLVILIYPLVQNFGLIGAAYAALFSVVVEIPVITYYLYKIFYTKSEVHIYENSSIL